MISVIVPVYHVEKYLKTCVESIQNQTYKELEIILVDDGSKDSCSDMCDSFAEQDSRIRVLHKENGGLSDARNAGLEIATGEYISFVDADDFIHPEMYERMVFCLERNPDMELVICRYDKVGEEARESVLKQITNDHYVLEHDALISAMFSDDYEMFVVVWNKLYRKNVWETLRFPVGKLREDEFVSYKYLYPQKRVLVMHDRFYCYRQRRGSIMQTCEERAYWDNTEALQEKMHFFEKKGETEYAACVERSLSTLIYYYECAEKYDNQETKKRIRKVFLEEWRRVKQNGNVHLRRERIVYFNSFSRGTKWMELYMPIYWKKCRLSRKIKQKARSEYYHYIGKKQAGTAMNPKIATIEETLEKIIREKCSVSRYGDGEYKWMAGVPQASFQQTSPKMTDRLIEICKSEEPNHLVCLSDGFDKLDHLSREARYFWYGFMGEHRKRWISYLKPGKQYYNTNMTRPYMDYLDKSPCAHRFQLLKEIWRDRDVVLIEGDKSRLGVGNDLFHTAKSIRRILAPARDAFGKYEEIFEAACKLEKDALYLIALGPTATILAYDLHKTGRQAIDVGHVDIEYEWFLMGAAKKVAIHNKYVNEVDAGLNCTEQLDDAYQSQIIAKIQW